MSLGWPRGGVWSYIKVGPDLNIQIVSNEAGEPTAVIVPIELWREITSERETAYLQKSEAMVRPERRVVLTGASPVRVSNGAPGSRLQPGGEIRPRRAGYQKPLKEKGANQRAATISERNSLVRLSAERCLGGPSRSFHGEGNRQHPGPKRMLDLPGVSGGGTMGKSNAEQERPNLAA